MATQRITELRRTGAGQLEALLTTFEWNSQTRSMMQGVLSHELAVKTVREEVPGSDTPVEQVLAATWQPFEFEGEWRDSYAGRSFAMDTYREFSRLVGRAPLVRLQLDQLSFVGLLTNLTLIYQTRDRIGWKVRMSPHTNELVGNYRERQAAPRVTRPIDQWVSDVEDPIEQITGFSEAAKSIPAADTTVIDIAPGVDRFNDALDDLKSTALEGLGADAERTLFSLASKFRRVRGAGIELVQTVGQKRADLSVAFDDAIQTLKFTEWTHNTVAEGYRAIGLSSKAEVDMRATAARKPRAIHRCQAGESLERISLRYYGTANNWRAIYDANNLQTLLVDGGQELIIPERGA
jgi:hypothetical protein